MGIMWSIHWLRSTEPITDIFGNVWIDDECVLCTFVDPYLRIIGEHATQL